MSSPNQPHRSQHQSPDHSHDPSETSQQNDLPLLSSSIPTGIHVSPFNEVIEDTHQPVEPSSGNDPLASLSDPTPSLVQEEGSFHPGTSENGPSAMAMRVNKCAISASRNAEALDKTTVNQFSHPPQLTQLHDTTQHRHHSQQSRHTSSQRGFQTVNSTTLRENAPTETPLNENGSNLLIPTAVCPSLQFKSPNIHLSSTQSHMAGQIPNISNNSGGLQTQFDLHQPTSSHVAACITRGTKRPFLAEPNPFEMNRFTPSFSRIDLGTSSGHFSANDTLSPINPQNQFPDPQRSYSQYMSRPGQIFERVLHQVQIPFQSAQLYHDASTSLNQRNHGHSPFNVAPFSHSISTNQFVPIQPAASSESRIQDISPAKTHSRDRDCDTCGKTFKSKKDLLRHVGRMHILKGRHPCPRTGCNQSFAEAHKLKRHINTVHLKCRPFQCPVCSATFGEKGNMSQHFRKAHAGGSSKATKKE